MFQHQTKDSARKRRGTLHVLGFKMAAVFGVYNATIRGQLARLGRSAMGDAVESMEWSQMFGTSWKMDPMTFVPRFLYEHVVVVFLFVFVFADFRLRENMFYK